MRVVSRALGEVGASCKKWNEGLGLVGQASARGEGGGGGLKRSRILIGTVVIYTRQKVLLKGCLLSLGEAPCQNFTGPQYGLLAPCQNFTRPQ